MHIVSKSTMTLAAAVALAVMSGSALAYEAGDMVVRAGPVNVSPNDSSSELNVGGSDVANSGATVDDDTQLGVSFTYMLSPKFGVEVLAATPFTHSITADTGAAGLGVVPAGETTHLPPTISAQYYPMGAASKLQPYVGAGLNVTLFFDEQPGSTLESVFGDGSLELDPSVGLALQAGVDYSINDHWGVNAAVWYIDISTDATYKLTADDGTETQIKATVDVDPTVFMFGAAYKF